MLNSNLIKSKLARTHIYRRMSSKTNLGKWHQIKSLYKKYGNENYMINEPVSQIKHAIYTHQIMKNILQYVIIDESPKTQYLHQIMTDMKCSAFLHDIGHFLTNDTPVCPSSGYNDRHELVGYQFLKKMGFSPIVYKPVYEHVNAKRYLCAVDKSYEASLSLGSSQSLKLQGGPMTLTEANIFSDTFYFRYNMLLRECDDASKNVEGVMQLFKNESTACYLDEIKKDILDSLDKNGK